MLAMPQGHCTTCEDEKFSLYLISQKQKWNNVTIIVS